MILSSAITGKSPFRRLVVHGFTTDSDGHKMSKSLGNVISPSSLLMPRESLSSHLNEPQQTQKHLSKSGSAIHRQTKRSASVVQRHTLDVLRCWAAASALSSRVPFGYRELDKQAIKYRQVRNGFRFMLGNLNDYCPLTHLAMLTNTSISNPVGGTLALFSQLSSALLNRDHSSVSHLSSLDRVALTRVGWCLNRAASLHYPAFTFDSLIGEVDNLFSWLSSTYHTSVKDR
ncbi:unnamed protein product [Protopolystoma xenopodis]|uniref:Aminoacyl-tRNA synthetase class Ia domain-containing protein n=1 Tax=Protopolystoma xenopodis TaxID=117903 RepID=A0A3S5B4R5_9PLAT|nr:unnamed protein product [Protopolystoma xenopodis]